ncbi:MAG: class I SAM-dependent methyltransferase [Desulfovibrionaceae bacterium]|nr:class I SAM-dependent methyltransferase [Desulfovibrionaceae bacterium]
MSEPKRAFVDFYDQHKISPVSQDISDIDAHYARREALYRHLGLVPSFLRDKSVIEFGPGSGHNALYTASLEPSRYVFVEGNPTGLDETRRRLEGVPFKTKFVQSYFENFQSKETFDLVLCEGVLPWQKAPAKMMQQIASFVAPHGMLIVTTNDEISALSETLRQLQAALIVDRSLPIMKQVEQLLPVFEDDLNSLKGMSRPHEDWILDQVLQPFVGSMFPIEAAITAVDDAFDVYATSPKFMTDWTWYKEVPIRDMTNNELGIDCYQKNVHNFMDYRFTFPPRPTADNMRLYSLVAELTRNELLFESGGDRKYLPIIQQQIKDLIGEVRQFSEETAECLADFSQGFDTCLETGTFPKLKRFSPFFGRGQQYVSFLRR